MVKNLPANAGDARDMGLIPGLGRSPGVGNGNPLWYSCQDRGAWQSTGHGVAKSWMQLSTYTHRFWERWKNLLNIFLLSTQLATLSCLKSSLSVVSVPLPPEISLAFSGYSSASFGHISLYSYFQILILQILRSPESGTPPFSLKLCPPLKCHLNV